MLPFHAISLLCSCVVLITNSDLELYLASKTVSIHREVGNTDLLLFATHDNSVISFPPSVNETVFQISSTAEEANLKIIRDALLCIKVGCSCIEIQSIGTDVLILLLAYIGMELV